MSYSMSFPTWNSLLISSGRFGDSRISISRFLKAPQTFGGGDIPASIVASGPSASYTRRVRRVRLRGGMYRADLALSDGRR